MSSPDQPSRPSRRDFLRGRQKPAPAQEAPTLPEHEQQWLDAITKQLDLAPTDRRSFLITMAAIVAAPALPALTEMPQLSDAALIKIATRWQQLGRGIIHQVNSLPDDSALANPPSTYLVSMGEEKKRLTRILAPHGNRLEMLCQGNKDLEPVWSDYFHECKPDGILQTMRGKLKVLQERLKARADLQGKSLLERYNIKNLPRERQRPADGDDAKSESAPPRPASLPIADRAPDLAFFSDDSRRVIEAQLRRGPEQPSYLDKIVERDAAKKNALHKN